MRTQQQKELIRRRTSERMKIISEQNKCPVCLRKAALGIKFRSTGPVEVCRYCEYKRTITQTD